MKDEEPYHRNSNESKGHSTDDDGYSWVYRSVLTDKEYYEVDCCRSYCTEYPYKEKNEKSVVSLTYAVVHKGTVMVKHLNAIVAGRAVTRPGWSEYFAGLTLFSFGIGLCQWSVFLSRQVFEDGLSWNNARVATSCQIIEHSSEDDAKEEYDR